MGQAETIRIRVLHGRPAVGKPGQEYVLNRAQAEEWIASGLVERADVDLADSALVIPEPQASAFAPKKTRASKPKAKKKAKTPIE